MKTRIAGAAALLALLTSVGSAQPAAERPSTLGSFRFGTGGDVLCQMQNLASDSAMTGLFDRAYTITRRAAAAPVGRVCALRGDAVARVDRLRAATVDCAGAPARATISDLDRV